MVMLPTTTGWRGVIILLEFFGGLNGGSADVHVEADASSD